MKKAILFGLLLAIVAIVGMSSCNGCAKSEASVEPVPMVQADYDGVVKDFTAGAEHIQALHRQTMFSLVSQRCEWRNSKILFNDTIRTDNLDELKIVDITDVFQFMDNGPKVQFITSNVQLGTLIPKAVPDVWIEDDDLDNVEIRLTCKDVIERLKGWNGVIPSSVSMSLRLPVGPLSCNAQYVIGNLYQVIFIDAVTGEITDWNPAFPRT